GEGLSKTNNRRKSTAARSIFVCCLFLNQVFLRLPSLSPKFGMTYASRMVRRNLSSSRIWSQRRTWARVRMPTSRPDWSTRGSRLHHLAHRHAAQHLAHDHARDALLGRVQQKPPDEGQPQAAQITTEEGLE